ncbi:ChaN family lipoprotein [Haematobacter genomosp. 1]|uniref:Haem-binding uptake Tiki superfamily ChaN domain-containing protein n=1 Tax=Haematobacter genomosp. 1 TaxID=366618 RepID=A0A212ACF6_9RHOB|nr:ChaN family lipoprotein [Haematobacter genomosp. 1]OWJ78563.1 hypothetical protein CDV49_09085 [Haematobacter genomosp. 1]
MKWFAPVLFIAAAPVAADAVLPARLDDLPPAEVILLGEVHDNPRHHENQARAVAALKPKALVFEMLTPAQADLVTPQARQSSDALALATGWATSGWPDFSLYWPIFAAAPEAAILGAGVTREDMAGLREKGAAALFGPEAHRFALDRPLPAEAQQAAEEEQRLAHCDMLPGDLLPMMVDAQRLRDAALARATLRALAEHGPPVVVIAGSGHVRAGAVPAMLKTAAPDLRVISVGQVEEGAAAQQPFDLWIVTPPEPRDDPCASLRKP